MRKSIIFCLLATICLASEARAELGVRRGGSTSSLMYDVAVRDKYTFLKSPADVMLFVELGILVPLSGNFNYTLSGASFPYVRPDVKVFVENLSAEYRWTCGERLVVTSATRPTSRQPKNAARLSVHPAGIALDLRIPTNPSCKAWLEKSLERLMKEGVIVALREYNPSHYHLAVFPKEYRVYLAKKTQSMCTQPVAHPLEGMFFGSGMRGKHMNMIQRNKLLVM